MQLEHSFTVPVGIAEAWKVLLDIERVAPCMPGAAVENVEGNDFTGSVKVKLGPISLTYRGKASFVEKDEMTHRASIDALGKDTRGGGTAGASVIATLATEGVSVTRVDVVTDLNITGKPAQFGRGVMVDVGNKLIGQFADNLAAQLSQDASASGASASVETFVVDSASTQEVEPVDDSASIRLDPVRSAFDVSPPRGAQDVEPIDLMASAGPAIVKRALPLLAGVTLLIVVLLLRRQRR